MSSVQLLCLKVLYQWNTEQPRENSLHNITLSVLKISLEFQTKTVVLEEGLLNTKNFQDL